MMPMRRCTLPVILLVLSAGRPVFPQTATRTVDVLKYTAAINPDIEARSVSGEVTIHVQFVASNVTTVEFDRSDLVIEGVRYEGKPVAFELPLYRLRVLLPKPARRGSMGDFVVSYRGKPRSGVQFVPDRRQVYTIFSTSQWLVCVDDPDDKATLDLQVTLPAGLLAIGSGTFVGDQPGPDGTVVHRWRQTQPVSTYLFGFAAGRFSETESRQGATLLRYAAENLSRDQLNRLFADTSDMVDFFSEHAGMPLPGGTYTQVLVANTAGQEAAGFSILSEAYGRAVLNDPTAVSLIAHELAHQWWGNLVTCHDWTHFWLNEGFATFMAAAYDERRFGPEAYRRDIERIRVRYDEVRQNGGDRSLAFPDWNRPSASDRTIVYQKGAYVLHRLREQIGDDAFWAGIRRYTLAHAGRSVTTEDFKRSMEESTGSNLGAFFDKWVYLRP